MLENNELKCVVFAMIHDLFEKESIEAYKEITSICRGIKMMCDSQRMGISYTEIVEGVCNSFKLALTNGYLNEDI